MGKNIHFSSLSKRLTTMAFCVQIRQKSFEGLKSMCKRFKITYFLSIWMNFMSIEWIVVKTEVLPWTTHSRVSGIATGVHVAKKTGSLREQSGRNETKWPSTRTTFWSPNRIWRRAFRETFIRQRNIRVSGVTDELREEGLRISSLWIAWWSCFSMMS